MLLTYLIPIFAITVVVAFHELGHLLAAKFCKVSVEVFSIGIGKKLLTFRHKETEYAISAIPLGGYCKLKGGDPNSPIEEDGSADIAHPLKKVLIYFAGPLFNFLITVFFIFIINIMPIHQKIEPVIYPLTGKELPGEVAGLRKGDRIISINNNSITDFSEISNYITDLTPIEIKIERNNEILVKVVTPKEINNRFIVGINPFIPLEVINSGVNKILKGDIIVAVDSIEVDNLVDLMNTIQDSSTLTIERNSNYLEIPLSTQELNSIDFTQRYSKPLLASLSSGFTETIFYTRSILSYLSSLVKKGEIGSNISSPIRLVYDVGNSFSSTILNDNLLFTIHKILITMASISLTLGIINLLPIPILDGGQIILNLITFIKGSKIKPKIIYFYQIIGIAIILLIFVLGFGNDILYLGDKL